MTKANTHTIRPAGRLLLTIGRDLIQDPYAAIVELAKNAYDADSPDVIIEYHGVSKRNTYTITVSDRGHGMTYDDVVTKWLVPSTSNKLARRTSPAGRVMQGRKGVGRYAAAVLGSDLYLTTVTFDGTKTEALLNWADFEQAEYLDQVEVLVNTSDTRERPGTRLVISGEYARLDDWTQTQFDKLTFELRKLKSPIDKGSADDGFEITINIKGVPNVLDTSETIEPYPILDLFDYGIRGKIQADGTGELVYTNQKIRNATDEVLAYNNDGPTNCGNLEFDIRVYDRDRTSIDALIERGLTNPSGSYFSNLQARNLLNHYNGIGVYRGGFRIRPLGDPDFDWLKLNSRRIQRPSLRIGSNQVIGFVQIEAEEQSDLIEKSARDGLRDNGAFENLKEVARKVIGELETRRFTYRRMVGLSRRIERIEGHFSQLFSSSQLERNVRHSLAKSSATERMQETVMSIIRADQTTKNRLVDEIHKAVAVYQGEATLGRIVNVIVHEGRRPLNYFSNQIPTMRYWYTEYGKSRDRTIIHRILTIASGVADHAESLVALFGRIDPLAAGRRSDKQDLDLKDTLETATHIFDVVVESQNVEVAVDCPDGVVFRAWAQDIYAILANLIDNSLYWMEEKKIERRRIDIDVVLDRGLLSHIDYRDNGPGIETSLISSRVIFEPDFSTKPDGTGLGLAIAGEAATRNGLELKVFSSTGGAWFRLQSVVEDEELSN